MAFCNSAIATLAPDLDLFGEIQAVVGHFAERHGSTIANQLGGDPNDYVLDMTGMKSSFGLDPTVETFTYRDIQARRELIRERLAKRSR